MNKIVLELLAKRILNAGLNPKTKQSMLIDDLISEVKTEVEDYILIKTGYLIDVTVSQPNTTPSVVAGENTGGESK